MYMKRSITTFMFATAALPVMAHDAWIVPNGDGSSYELVYGHPGELESYDPSKVEGISAVDKNGKRQSVTASVQNGKVEIKPGPDVAMIAIDYDNGFWTEGPDKKHINKPKWEISDAKSSSHSVKFNKNILAWNSSLSKPIGAEFEIVPMTNPLKLKAGDKLPVQVIYQSKPLAGADVQVMGNKEVYTTDKEGKVSIPLQKTDYQYLAVSHKEDTVGNPNADVLSLSANLVFTPK
jgi:uncharacterized GH25 family protein